MIDFHVHTKFSGDSEADMEKYILAAKEKNIDWICFTDHVDWNTNDYGYNYYSPNIYFETYNKIKEMYRNEVSICAGIEFGEPHLYHEKLKQLSALPYDFIIGSVHWIGSMFPCQEVRRKYSAKEFYML